MEAILTVSKNGSKNTDMFKKFKMVSINYTNNCAKKPRCSFCYLKRAEVFGKLSEKKPPKKNIFDSREFKELLGRTEQVAIAYNGLEISYLNHLLKLCFPRVKKGKLIVNITTIPRFLSETIVALFKHWKVEMVALSLDPEKCNLNSWILKARLLRKFKIKVGVNILMLDEVFPNVSDIIEKIHKLCYQIHLLRPKFYKTEISVKKRKELVWLLKQKYRNLFIDECFKWEFTGVPCGRGKDFISINADGTTSLCSFDIYRINRRNIKRCPYI